MAQLAEIGASEDRRITTSDTQVGTGEVPALQARLSSTQSIELTAPLTPGTYCYGACVDAVADEADTTNNCSEGTWITVMESDHRLGDVAVITTPGGNHRKHGTLAQVYQPQN